MENRRRTSVFSVAAAAAGVVLLASGQGHRMLSERIASAARHATELAAPLETLPLQLGTWQGVDMPLDADVLRIPGFEEEHINRRYAHHLSQRSVDVFVGYTGRPRTRLGHRPDVCYAAHGWERVSERRMQVPVAVGRTMPGILYEFRPPGLSGSNRLVLAAFLANGTYQDDPESYNRRVVRNPGLSRTRPRYTARVQIALTATGDILADTAVLSGFASGVMELIESRMPYWNE